MANEQIIRFIDLFAGMGGIRLGLENVLDSLKISSSCVATSEIKPYAIKALEDNFDNHSFVGDISSVNPNFLPDHDLLLAGFPCQPFSSGGKRKGFSDTRGTLFFQIEKIIEEKRPKAFILENVEGLVKHDLVNRNDDIGNTLYTILDILENKLNYSVEWKVYNSLDFGLPQSRKRVFIIGHRDNKVKFAFHKVQKKKLFSILESGLPSSDSEFANNILASYNIEDLYGKSIKDKRGGDNNIHSWDIGYKGIVSRRQKELLNRLFKERRKKAWAKEIGIDWMDGMPLTFNQINTFAQIETSELRKDLDDLVNKGYLRLEYPKKKIQVDGAGGSYSKRVYDESLEKGYNIVTGKLSFEFNKILDPNDIAPTIVATDVSKLAVPDKEGLRKLSIREGLRLFGYPETYYLDMHDKYAFDLLGNTVAIPVVEHVVRSLLNSSFGIELNNDYRKSGISNLVPV